MGFAAPSGAGVDAGAGAGAGSDTFRVLTGSVTNTSGPVAPIIWGGGSLEVGLDFSAPIWAISCTLLHSLSKLCSSVCLLALAKSLSPDSFNGYTLNLRQETKQKSFAHF